MRKRRRLNCFSSVAAHTFATHSRLEIDSMRPSTIREDLSARPGVMSASLPGDFIGFGFESLWIMSGGKLWRTRAVDNKMIGITVGHRGRMARHCSWGRRCMGVRCWRWDHLQSRSGKQCRCREDRYCYAWPRGQHWCRRRGSVWVTTSRDQNKTLMRYNAVTGVEEAAIALPGPGIGVVVDDGSIWVTGFKNNELYRIDPTNNVLAMASRDRTGTTGSVGMRQGRAASGSAGNQTGLGNIGPETEKEGQAQEQSDKATKSICDRCWAVCQAGSEEHVDLGDPVRWVPIEKSRENEIMSADGRCSTGLTMGHCRLLQVSAAFAMLSTESYF